MKIIKKIMKHGKITVAVQNLDDLWHLSQIVEQGDVVRGKTTRKIKAEEKQASRKTITLSVRVEEKDFRDRRLRLNGITVDEMDDIPRGSHHTISVEEGSVLQIVKSVWPRYALSRLEQATEKQRRAVIMVMDREEAVFALLNSQGYEMLASIRGKVAKKGYDTVTGNFYRDLGGKLEEYWRRMSPDSIIVASPAFWKDDFMKEFRNEEVRKRIVTATCSSVGKNAIEEVIRRPELKEVLRKQRVAEESKFVEKLMAEIGRDGLAAYGRKEVENAVSSGNAERLLITDAFISGSRRAAEELMKNAEALKGDVVIINSENEAGKKLDALGGVGVLLRYAAH